VELGLHCGEELINGFMGVTYNQEAEDDLLEHIKSHEQAEESKDVSISCSQHSNYQLANRGCVVMESLGHKS
jgi:hypothetical protein